MSKHTKGPWLFRKMESFDSLHKLKGTTPEEHEGYFRSNNGDWVISHEDGRICEVDFKGKAKRGQGYLSPDPEGMANARIISAAPDMYEALANIRKMAAERFTKEEIKSLDRILAKAEGRSVKD